MLRRVAVREVDGRRDVGHEDDQAVRGQGLPRDIRALERCELQRQLFEHRMGEHRAVGDQDGAGHRVVLGLSQQIGGDELRIGGFVGDQQRLGRTGKLVDIDDAEDTALGQHDEDVARSVDLVDVGNGLGAIGHRRDGLRATDAKDAIDAGHLGRRQDQRRDFATRSTRRADDDLLHAGDARRHGGHQQRRWIDRRPARGVDADAIERTHDLTQRAFVAVVEP